jgi:hypothetical protein
MNSAIRYRVGTAVAVLGVAATAATVVRRWAAVVGVAVVAVTGLQVVTAQAASALPAYTVRTKTSGALGPGTTKWAAASCEAGEVVMGGGGEIVGGQVWTTVLTGLQPKPLTGGIHQFVVSGRALRPEMNESWQVKAYAWCAPEESMPGYLVIKTTTGLSQEKKWLQGKSVCTGGRVAYSAGVTTSQPGYFGVQMVRTSGPLDIARATVRAFHEMATPPWWTLSTYAVCGLPRDGVVAVAQLSGGPLSSVSCPSGTQQINGAGGGLGLSDGGVNWIRMLRPQSLSAPTTMLVQMSLNVGGYETVAHTTCGTKT